MRVCIVTDIHSRPTQAERLSRKLPNSAAVIRLALNHLCGRPDLTGDALHRHLFDQDGIQEAVSGLRRELKGSFVGLGYSAGGTALWRATAEGAPIAGLFCVSSTRLRDEIAITAPNHVFFGAEDENKPSSRWLASVPHQHTVFQDAGHSYYLQPQSDAARETTRIISEGMRKLTAISAAHIGL